MTGMTDFEAREWCERNGVGLRDDEPDTSRLVGGIYFAIPDTPSARLGLSRFVHPTTFDLSGTVLVWTREWGVWPSSEYMPLFTRFREALGESRPLSVANAQLFESAEAEDGQSYVFLNCLFLWDCWVIVEGGKYAVHLSHDEWGQLFAEPAVLSTGEKHLRAVGLIS
jgi:hypothetical protein